MKYDFFNYSVVFLELACFFLLFLINKLVQ